MFFQSGNSFGATARLGTIDNYDLSFTTNNTTDRLIIKANGYLWRNGTTYPVDFRETSTVLVNSKYSAVNFTVPSNPIANSTDTVGFVINPGAAYSSGGFSSFQHFEFGVNNYAGTQVFGINSDIYGNGTPQVNVGLRSAIPNNAYGGVFVYNASSTATRLFTGRDSVIGETFSVDKSGNLNAYTSISNRYVTMSWSANAVAGTTDSFIGIHAGSSPNKELWIASGSSVNRATTNTTVYYGVSHADSNKKGRIVTVASYDGTNSIYGSIGFVVGVSYNFNQPTVEIMADEKIAVGYYGNVTRNSSTSGLSAKFNVRHNSSNTTDEILNVQTGVSGNAVIFRVLNNGNLGINLNSFGSGAGVIAIGNASAVPSANPTGGGILYVDSGALKYRGTSGTVTTVASA